jgi:peptidoglycan hydrolase-like protein with peptidoglycan-binding domain
MKKLLAFVAVVAFALSATVASAATYNFTRDLTVGSTGADVVVLQDFLITKGHLVMPAGVSKGYFGSITAAALAKYQASVGISPAAGYFGPLTRAHFNAMTDTSTGGGTNPPGQGDLSGGEGDIKDFDVLSSPNNEDIEEDTEVEIFGFEFEAEDSDLAFERLDFHVEQVGATEIWDVIDEAILYQGDEEVDSIDGLDDEDEWADEDNDVYRLRFAPDTVVKEGDSDRFYVAFVGQSNIDSADLTGADFDVFIPEDGIRVIDAEGIDIYAPSSNSDEKSIGADEQAESAVTITESDDNPDTGIIVVDDEDDTEDVDVLAFEIESEDSGLELDEIRVHATSSSSTLASIVSDLVLEIDGQEFDGDYAGATASTSSYWSFDIDGDVEIDEDDMAEAVVRASFNKQDGNYAASGETVVFAVHGNATSIQGESTSTGDDIVNADIDGSVDGNTLTLGLAGIDVEVVEKDSELITPQTGSPYVSHTFVFKVTSLSETVYIPLTASSSSSTAGFDFDVTAGTGTTTITVDQLTDRTETENSVKLSSGQSAEFEVVVTFNPTSDQSYRAELDNVHFSETAGDYETTFVAPDESEFKSSNTFVPGN